MTVGIRPLSFRDADTRGARIDLYVVVSEYLGAQSVLVTRGAGTEILVEMDSASPIPSGGTMAFSVDPNEMMLFDRTSGVTL